MEEFKRLPVSPHTFNTSTTQRFVSVDAGIEPKVSFLCVHFKLKVAMLQQKNH